MTSATTSEGARDLYEMLIREGRQSIIYPVLGILATDALEVMVTLGGSLNLRAISARQYRLAYAIADAARIHLQHRKEGDQPCTMWHQNRAATPAKPTA